MGSASDLQRGSIVQALGRVSSTSSFPAHFTASQPRPSPHVISPIPLLLNRTNRASLLSLAVFVAESRGAIPLSTVCLENFLFIQTKLFILSCYYLNKYSKYTVD